MNEIVSVTDWNLAEPMFPPSSRTAPTQTLRRLLLVGFGGVGWHRIIFICPADIVSMSRPLAAAGRVRTRSRLSAPRGPQRLRRGSLRACGNSPSHLRPPLIQRPVALDPDLTLPHPSSGGGRRPSATRLWQTCGGSLIHNCSTPLKVFSSEKDRGWHFVHRTEGKKIHHQDSL